MKLNLNCKKIVISLLAFSLLIFNVPVYAENIDSYSAVISTNKDNVNKGEEITITISLKDINIESGEKGIGAYTANLDFNSSVLEYVSSEGTDKWEAPMYYNGKIVGNTKDGKVMTEEGNIGTIKFKVKEDASLGEITVSLVNFSGSNAEKDIKATDYSIKIMVKDGDSGNTGDDPQEGDEGQGGSQGETGDPQGGNGSQEEAGNGQGENGSQGEAGNGQGENGSQEEAGNGQGENGSQGEAGNGQSGNGSQGQTGNGQGGNGSQGENENSQSGNDSQNGNNSQNENKGNSNGETKFPNTLPRTGENNMIIYLVVVGMLFLVIAICLGIKLLKSRK